MLQSKDIQWLNGFLKKEEEEEEEEDPYMCCLQETHFKSKDTQTESEGWRKLFHVNRNEKKAGLAILTSDKIDFKTKTVTRDKEDII